MKKVYVVGYGFLNGTEWVAEGISCVCLTEGMATRIAEEITEAGIGYVSGPVPLHCSSGVAVFEYDGTLV